MRNIRYANVTELLLAKQQEQERCAKTDHNQVVENILAVTILGTLFTAIGLLAAWQEGLWP